MSNAGSDDVYVINGANNKVIEHIPVGDFPVGIAYNPTNNDVYVVNAGNSTVSVIDASIDSVIDTIPLESVQPPNIVGPYSITYDRTNGGMYAGGTNSHQISAINTASNADVKDVRMPTPAADSQAAGLVHNPNNNRIYVTAIDSNAVVKINPDTNEFEGSPIPVEMKPFGIVYNPGNNRIYVNNAFSNTVSVINPTTNAVTNTIPTGTLPVGIAYNPNNNHIYVTNFFSNTTSIIHP